MPTLKILNPGFSTADAEYPSFSLSPGKILLTFKDHHGQLIQVDFEGVHAIKWQEAEILLPDEPYDGSCEILDSDWLTEHKLQDSIPNNSNYHHFRFNFNACGQFDVICTHFVFNREAIG